LVQTTRPLSYNSQLKVTTAKYYIPSGRCIQAVDYLNRNEDGSVGYMPDSLIREFKTMHNRLVYDGGGISPDIIVEPDLPGNITVSLYSKNLIFDFATVYSVTHEFFSSIDYPDFSDEDYLEFKNFLKDKTMIMFRKAMKSLMNLLELPSVKNTIKKQKMNSSHYRKN